jgi:hypothetical protein
MSGLDTRVLLRGVAELLDASHLVVRQSRDQERKCDD